MIKFIITLLFLANLSFADNLELQKKQLQSSEISEIIKGIKSTYQMSEVPKELIPILSKVLKYEVRSKDVDSQLNSLSLNILLKKTFVKIGRISIPELRKVMKTKSNIGRWRTIEILYNLQDDAVEALPEIIEALKDENKKVRYFAARAIMNFGPRAKGAIPNLIILLDDKEESPREFAIKALASMGSVAKKSLPKLKQLARHEDLLTQNYAKEAIEKIDVNIR